MGDTDDTEEMDVMDTLLANADGHWPGPWILLVPLFWAAAVVLVVLILRRTVWRRGPWSHGCGPGQGGQGPLATLGDRYARGEIDVEEYRARRSVLTEHLRQPQTGGGK
ncbi:SHOCT domain-containing protein [Kitasatospora paranensis]|uniref:SHOCT domain-containing protein n=1 Tax=Kitasatospora paranensis TaxID=258053 RepID=A0ABW2FUC8_9ACTN